MLSTNTVIIVHLYIEQMSVHKYAIDEATEPPKGL